MSLIKEKDNIKSVIKNQNFESIMKFLLKLNNLLFEPMSYNDFLNEVLVLAANNFKNINTGSILISDRKNEFSFVAVYGFEFQKVKNIKIDSGKTFIGVSNGGKINKTIYVNDVKKFYSENNHIYNESFTKNLEISKIGSTISSPIVIDGNTYGMLNFDSFEKNAFSEEDVLFVNYIRNHIEIAIKNKLYADEISYLTKFDKLTDTYNRNYFENIIIKKYFVKKNSFVLVYFDMDNLKVTNDIFGHHSGDILLKAFSEKIKDIKDNGDIVCRLGGDEFIGIFFNKNIEIVSEIIERARNELREEVIRYNNKILIAEFSYGCASYPNDSDNYELLVKIADQRMYKNKTARK